MASNVKSSNLTAVQSIKKMKRYSKHKHGNFNKIISLFASSNNLMNDPLLLSVYYLYAIQQNNISPLVF